MHNNTRKRSKPEEGVGDEPEDESSVQCDSGMVPWGKSVVGNQGEEPAGSSLNAFRVSAT